MSHVIINQIIVNVFVLNISLAFFIIVWPHEVQTGFYSLYRGMVDTPQTKFSFSQVLL